MVGIRSARLYPSENVDQDRDLSTERRRLKDEIVGDIQNY